jgi:hypothetical protein
MVYSRQAIASGQPDAIASSGRCTPRWGKLAKNPVFSHHFGVI